jgi:hypothetical protein
MFIPLRKSLAGQQCHMVVRGIRSDGGSLRLSRDYVQHGIRSVVEDRCTRQLGYRTELDAIESQRREITEKRFTSIDRRFLRDASDIPLDLGPHYFSVIRNPVQADLSESARVRARHDAARLAVLERMGLAESSGSSAWRVRRDFDQILRAMQQTTDRQKTLAAHGVVMSDSRLVIEALDSVTMTSVEGRVLVHGQDEQSGRKLPDAGRNRREGLLNQLHTGNRGGPQPWRTADGLVCTVRQAVRGKGSDRYQRYG